MRWPLRNQFLVPFCGVMLAVVCVTSVLNAYLAARRDQLRIQDQLLGIARELDSASFPLTDAVLTKSHGLSGAEFVLTDTAGMLRASSLDRSIALGLSLPLRVGKQFAWQAPIDLAGKPYLHATLAMSTQGPESHPEIMHILYPAGDLRLARWQAAYPPLLVGGIMLGAVIVLSVMLAARLSSPILALREQLSRLVAGDFQPLPLPRRNDEMQDLVGSVNLLKEQLEEMRHAIKRSERLALLGQFSGGLAHQLRNALTGARLAVQLHQRTCGSTDLKSLEVALRQLTLTETHLQRFLNVGLPPALNRQRCDVSSIVSDVAQLVTPAARHLHVRLDVHDAPQPLPLLADAEQLRQLLVNIVLNALEAASPQGWVRIEAESQDGIANIRVFDSGSGPNPVLADRLFEPFVTGKTKGVGLGLFVARQIAEAHGGTLRYLAETPTCFELLLPVEPTCDMPLASHPSSADVTLAPTDARQKTRLASSASP